VVADILGDTVLVSGFEQPEAGHLVQIVSLLFHHYAHIFFAQTV